jgi:hypothetical protein
MITEIAFGFSPLGPLLDAGDFADSYNQGSWGGMALAGVGLIPGGDLLKLRKFGDLADAAKSEVTVIGRVKDLQKLGPGEKSLLDRLPDLGSPKANWQQNSGVLRQEMNRGLPIRDASVGDTGGQFLNAERNLLRDRGWTFDGSHWNPSN